MSSSSGDTIILGAGIIGLSTAYYLSQSGNTTPESIRLIDTSAQLFHCASGFAGGFLALDWFAPSNASLGALSYGLHKSLADENDGRKTWGYRGSTGLSLSQDSEAAVGGSGEDWLADGTSRAEVANAKSELDAAGPRWLKRTEGSLEVISLKDTVAQIDPLRYCRWLLERCLERGVKLLQPATAISVLKDEQNQLNGLKIIKDGTESNCAWSPRVFSKLFPKSKARIPVSHLASHSLLVRNPFHNAGDSEIETCHAVFATDTLGFSPEWFSRGGGELYLAGLNSTMIPLPEHATEAEVSDKAIEQMKQCAAEMLGAMDGKPMEVIREALCFRPVTASGRPLVCRVPDETLGGGVKTRGNGEGGVFMSAGHGAWGISQAPGTGLVMSEMIEGRQTSANISALGLPS